MTAIPGVILLQAEGAPAGDIPFIYVIGVMFLIFYLLVIRPQQRQRKQHEEAIKGAVKGDRVVTAGGLHGVVTGVADDTLTVEIARVKGGAKVEVEVSRSSISSVVKAGAKEGSDGS